jgi:hypothetical protein
MHSYVIEYSTVSSFVDSKQVVVLIESLQCARLTSFRGLGKDYLQYILKELDPGIEYFVRIAAVNKVGDGKTTLARPEVLAPGSKCFFPQQWRLSLNPVFGSIKCFGIIDKPCCRMAASFE